MTQNRSRRRSQEFVSSFLHGVALFVSITGLIFLIVMASWQATPWHIVGFSIYGTSLILLYAASFLFHFVNAVHSYQRSLQKIDHAMIFVLIAGTYTPICLTVIRGGWGWSLLGIIWFLGIGGILAKIFDIRLFHGWFSAVYYLLMGWIVIIAAGPMIRTMHMSAFLWLLVGGLFYSVGVIFFALEHKIKGFSYFGMHEIFHLFVILGSACHFWVMYRYVL